MELIYELTEAHKEAVKAQGFTDEQITEAETELSQYRGRRFDNVIAGKPLRGFDNVGVSPCAKAFIVLMAQAIEPIGEAAQ